MKAAFFVLALLATLAAATKVDYSGHKVIRVVPQTEFHLRFLLKLQQDAYDFWSAPSKVGNSVDIRTSPEQYMRLAMLMQSIGLDHTIHVEDIGKLLKAEEKEIALGRAIAGGKAFDFTSYHTYEEIIAWVTELAASSALVQTETIGRTGQGRDIVMTRISSDFSANKRVMYFECAMHAREWVTPPTCLWIVNELTTKYGSDAEITALLDYADWLITPISNPDGYAYTWATDRLWRKNRQANTGSSCIGTDPNRNFDADFGGPGTSDSPCSDTYHGPAAFSSPEASAMRDVLEANRGRVLAALSIHAYSQYWMSPYGYTSAASADFAQQNSMMEISVNALRATYGTSYQYGSIADVIYLAAGSSIDYAYDNLGIVYSFALEMRDTGLYGFRLPANQIIPTATETFNGFKAMVAELQRRIP